MTSDDSTSYLPKLIQGLLYAALGVLVIWAIALFMGARSGVKVLPGTEEARVLARKEIRKQVDKAALALHEVKWIDQEKGSVHLPIERAMELAAMELAKKELRATNVTVAWVPPQMPDYNAPAPEEGAEAGPGEAEAVAPVSPEIPVTETPGAPTTEAQAQPEAPRLPESPAPPTAP